MIGKLKTYLLQPLRHMKERNQKEKGMKLKDHPIFAPLSRICLFFFLFLLMMWKTEENHLYMSIMNIELKYFISI